MKIVIVDSDPCSRAAIEQSLERHQCQQALVMPPEALPKSPDALLWVKDADDTPLAGAPKLKDSDQFARPFRIGALLDRVNRYIFQLSKGISPDYIEIGPYRLDTRSGELLDKAHSDAPVRLTDKEVHILTFLAAQGGDFVERDILLDEVWGYAKNVETHTLETHIYRLRQKIEKDPSNPTFLITADQGYKVDI